MRNSRSKRINIEYDGSLFVYINPEFIAEEKEKIEEMSEEEVVDYILFGSAWSVAFEGTGWRKTKAGKTATYRNERHEIYHSQHFGNTSDETEIQTLEIRRGKFPVYTRSVTGTITYDDGRVRSEKPIFEKATGDEAIDIVTGGIWRIILGK